MPKPSVQSAFLELDRKLAGQSATLGNVKRYLAMAELAQGQDDTVAHRHIAQALALEDMLPQDLRVARELASQWYPTGQYDL